MKRVFGLHLMANAILVGLVYVWLGIRDARALQIAVTLLLGTFLIASALFLHAGTWHWMETRNWRISQRALLRFALGAVILLAAWWLLSLIPMDRAAQATASLLTFKSRKPVSPESVGRVFAGLLWLTKWFVVPILILRQHRNPRFWFILAAVLLFGVYVPERLVHWTPMLKGTAAQVISLAVRWGVAYLLATAGWLTVLRFISLARVPVSGPLPSPDAG